MGRPDQYRDGYPSVTEVKGLLDKGLNFWWGAKGTAHCLKVMKESSDIGHRVHGGIERYLKTGNFSEASAGLSNAETVMLSRFVEWINENKVKPVFMEDPLYSEEYKFCGTPDLIATVRGGTKLQVIDWKTDSTPKTKAQQIQREFEYRLQCAGYSILYEENFGKKVLAGTVVRVTKDTHYLHLFDAGKLDKYKKYFLQMREIYKELKGV